MRIPWWIWVIIALSVLSWILPDGIPGEEFILPAIAIGSLLIRRRLLRGFYQQQYQQYQTAGAGGSAGTTYGSSGTGTGQSSSNFYNRFKGWGQGFQQPGQATDSIKDPYETLGIKKGASMDEIKKAYRGQLKKFHPDIVENLKLGPEYREMFEEKTRDIHKAYQSLGGK
ncbi:MAG: J domain-containing protein [Spirochaetota bacterium]|nr:MAG: J domain-containing protein [Spirochaetota bacterium]